MILQVIRGQIVEEKSLGDPVTRHQRRVHEWLRARTGAYPLIVCRDGRGRKVTFTSYREFARRPARPRENEPHRRKLRAAWRRPATRARHRRWWNTGGRRKLSRTMKKIWREMRKEATK